jgi:hypothetical protein
MWYRKIILAERGKLNKPIANREFGKLFNQALVFDGPDKVSIDFTKLDSLVKSNFYLSDYISKVVEDTSGERLGGFWSGTKEVSIKQISLPSQIDDVIGTFIHEIVHALDPGIRTKQQYEMKIRPQYTGNLNLSFEDNVKIQAILRTANFLPYENEDVKKQHMDSYIKYPEALLEDWNDWMKNYPEEMNKNLSIFSKQGLYINGSFLNKEQYEIYQKQYASKTGKISDLKYLDNRIEPVAWMTQIEREFSPHKIVRNYSGTKKFNKYLTPEIYIEQLKKGLTTDDITFIRSQVGSESAEYLFGYIKDPKIRRQMLEIILNNINKADILLKGGLVRLSKLDLRALNPEYANFINEYLKKLPVQMQKKFFITQDINGNFKGNFKGIQFNPDEYMDQSTIANWDKPVSTNKVQVKLVLPFSDKIGNNFVEPETSVELFKYCNNADCPKFNQVLDNKNPRAKFCKGCGIRLKFTTDVNSIKSTTTPTKAKTTSPVPVNAVSERLSAEDISKKTLLLPPANVKSSVELKSNLSKVLATIKKLFTALNAVIEKFNNTKTGKAFNYGMLAKDVIFIITLTDKISKQINSGEEVMLKDQLDLGFTIVSLLTDQQTQAILRTIYPPIIVLLNNPQIQAWLIGINIGANVYMGAVSLTDYFGTLSGTSNKSQGASAGIQNVPGGAQALVMPVFQLFDKYGEVFNALIDNEKGMTTEQSLAKHIMKDASGGIEPYRLSLFYKFRENKPRILAYQKSPAFKKLPVANQILYPNANSAYAISSYKKAKDAQEKARQDAYNRNFPSSSGGGGRALPVQ